MRGLVVTGAVAAALVAVAGAAAKPVPVRATDAYEVEPAPGVSYFAWSRARPSRPNRYNVFVVPAAGGVPNFSAPIKANRDGTVAFAGDIDDTTLVFGQRRRAGARGNIRFYDLSTHALVATPAGVNTTRHEAGPKLSGPWLLFARYGRSSQSIILLNVDTGGDRRLDSLGYPAYLQTGDVAGNWAVWTRCRRWSHCNTFRYNIAARRARRLPNPADRSQYAASVTDDGTVYFAESRNIFCGGDLALWRWKPSADRARARLHRFRSGRDVAVTNPVTTASETTLFYDRYICRSGAADIYKLAVP
jgi:hypothetical protein